MSTEQKQWFESLSRSQIGYKLPEIVVEILENSMREAVPEKTSRQIKRSIKIYNYSNLIKFLCRIKKIGAHVEAGAYRF